MISFLHFSFPIALFLPAVPVVLMSLQLLEGSYFFLVSRSLLLMVYAQEVYLLLTYSCGIVSPPSSLE